MAAAAAPTDVRTLTCTGRPRCLAREADTDELKNGWLRSRFDALRALGLTDRTAAALLSHYTRETGWGRSEHNFALGNIRWTQGVGGPAFYQQGSDDPTPRPYRAFGSLDDGARAAVALASSGRYAGAWSALQGGAPETEWYARLMDAGWHPYSDASLDDYAGVLRSVRARLGLAPSVQPTPLPYLRSLGPLQAPAPASGSVPILGAVAIVGVGAALAYAYARWRR